MLTLIRKLLRTKLAGLLFVLLIVAMAAWGVTDVFSGGLGANLIGAGDRKISETRFDNSVERVLSTQTDERGRSLTKEQALENGLIDQVFQKEQFDLALRAYADKMGLTASPRAIRNDLVETPGFLDVSGKFDPALYRALLEQNRLTPARYQDDIEASLTIDRLRRVPLAGLQVPTTLARVQAAYTAEQRNAEWFTITRDNLPEIGEPTEEDLQALYTERQSALREPERRRISLIRLSPDDFLSRSDVTDEDVSAFYDAYKGERYTATGTRVFTEFNFTDEALARAALGRIAGGANASQLEGLRDTARRTGGAELIANPRLADQAFSASAQAGAIFGPQQSGETWTIVRIEEIIPGEVTPLADVRDAIFNEIARSQAIGHYYDALPRFDDLIGTGAELEGIAEDLGTPVLSFDAVDARGVSQGGAQFNALRVVPGLLQSAFNRPAGTNTERFEDEEVTWIARVDEIIPEAALSFEDVRDTLAQVWTQQQLANQLQTAAADVERGVSAGEMTMAQAAAEYNAALQTAPSPLTRVNFQSDLPPALLGGLFEARKVGDMQSAPNPTGGYVVMRVTAIDRPSPEELTALARATQARTQTMVAEDLFQAFFVDMQGEVKLNVNETALAAYKARLVTDQ